ncbi:MAG: hypothetical protein A2286_01810 [Gammaproteobacteria bacterium RIFOXYA12_FULL_61_12]|nr:MAG: hypothetical protein A2514_06490 [Gammaproteobacteria bacterium RIFOXYD12_FULL_61_37]OGT94473.1 MAG: hypothetical protein A2286_01810 [Gammaproteobacteria bacterium RIFOXYA12_FULL_61_12]
MSWPLAKFEEVALPVKGSIVSGPFGSNIGSRFFVDEGVPVIRGNNLTFGQRRFIDDGFVYLTEEKAQEFRNCEAVEGDLVFTAAGTIGQVGIIPPDTCFERYIISNKQLRVRCDKGKVSPLFLFLWFTTREMRQHIINKNSGSTIPLINLGILRGLPVPLPPIEVQEQIAATISAYDDLIENNRRRMALLEESARLLYREWFVRLRFPGYEHTRITNGVPEGWEKVKVGSLLSKIGKGRKIKRDDYLESGPIPCVDQGVDFIGGYTDNEEALFTDPLPLIVFGDHTRVLKFVSFPFASGADGTQLIYPNTPRISPEYLYFSLKAIDLSNYFYARHFKFLKEESLLIPAESLVREFTRFAATNFEQINNLRTQTQKLRAARDLLLPRLMSGEIAV